MDRSKDCAITVEYQGKIYRFKYCQDGLYYYDTVVDNPISGATDEYNFPITPFFSSTVEDNKSYFSRNEIEGENYAIKVQQIIGWYITTNFKSVFKKQIINNCNVTTNDINHVELIYGPPTPLLQGKMTRYKPNSDQI